MKVQPTSTRSIGVYKDSVEPLRIHEVFLHAVYNVLEGFGFASSSSKSLRCRCIEMYCFWTVQD